MNLLHPTRNSPLAVQRRGGTARERAPTAVNIWWLRIPLTQNGFRMTIDGRCLAGVFRPEGTALTKPRASPCERSEDGRSPGLRTPWLWRSPNGTALIRCASHVQVSAAVPSRRSRSGRSSLMTMLSSTRLGPPLRGYRILGSSHPGLRQYSLRSHCLALGFVRAVPSGLMSSATNRPFGFTQNLLLPRDIRQPEMFTAVGRGSGRAVRCG